MAFWLNLTFKYYLSSLKIMEYSKDLKNFKDLDYLLGKDYIDGNYDLSKAILEKSASLLIEHSVTIQNRPFRDVYLVYNEKLEKDINEFIDNLKSSSLDYLDLLIGRDLYRLDSENYELSVIAKELKNDSLSYFWKYRKLKDIEEVYSIGVVSNQVKQNLIRLVIEKNLRSFLYLISKVMRIGHLA